MKILLLTDVPPCTNYTAGMVLSQIIKMLPIGSVVCFSVVNPDIQNFAEDPELSWMALEYAAKPRENGFAAGVPMKSLVSYAAERARLATVIPDLTQRIVDFGKRQKVDTVWAVLQGQTMVRLSHRVADGLHAPLYTHIWDPLKWWFDANGIDRLTRQSVQAEFDLAIRKSVAVATASPAMSKEYERRYGVRSIALIACHDRSDAFAPEPRPRREDELVIGMAGQFYANVEWQTLLRALDATDWVVGNRSARLLVLGHYVPDAVIPEGKVDFLGWRPQRDAIRILAQQADVLFCPYPFGAGMSEVARLSFPSKLVSYFAAGRPVLLHGPQDSSPAIYLAEHEAGLVTQGSGAANVHNALHRLATDAAFYSALAIGAQRAFLADFTLESMRTRVQDFFGIDVAAEASNHLDIIPFDRTSAATRLPPPRENVRIRVRMRQSALSLIRRTPARPIADAYVRGHHAFLHWRRERGRVARGISKWSLLVHTQNDTIAYISQRLEVSERHQADLERQLRDARCREAEREGQTDSRIREYQQRIQSLAQDLEAAKTAYSELEERLAATQQSAADLALEVKARETSLREQLEHSSRAYSELSEIYQTLNKRFDSVASASLGKLTMVEDAVRRLGERQGAPDASAPGLDDRRRYLDLLEGVLTGSVQEDHSISPWAEPGFSPMTRFLGRDWPEQALTMIGTTRMRNIRVLLETILRTQVPGDLIETGVWRGGACLYMRAILAAYGITDRTVWLADSFKGLPPPDPGAYPADANDTHHTQEKLAVSADQVRAAFRRFELLDDRVRFLEGWFKDTLASAPIERLALLRLDGDMFESTWEALEALYPKLSPGGFVIIDDYILPGCRKAVDEYRSAFNLREDIQEIDGAAVYWQKQAAS